MSWHVTNETGRLRDVLLCPPTFYHWIPTNAVALHTLAAATQFDKDAAGQQFDGLVSILRECGVTCHLLKPDPAVPYQVYTRDSSVTTPWGTLLTQLRLEERRGELASILEFYGAGGFWQCISAGTLEGGDVHLLRDGVALIGWSGVRTTEPAAAQLAGWLRDAGWQVRLQPFAEHFLHLDVLFCMATPTLAVACIEVLGDDFRAWLEGLGIDVIEASYREVMAMSCNILALGDNRVISPAHSSRLNAALREASVTVFDPALNWFAQGGGSVHCMTMPLRRDPV